VINDSRQKRLRLLIKQLNKTRKIQAQKTDILCNDIVSAHRGFLHNLKMLSFAANFYESLAGITELSILMTTAAEYMKDHLTNSRLAIVLRQPHSFELHIPFSEKDEPKTNCWLADYLTEEIVQAICKSNQICNLEEMLKMSMQIPPTMLGKLTAAAIPLGRFGISLGFIIIWKNLPETVTENEIKYIQTITPGLTKAIQAAQKLETAHIR